eukprot:scaffold218_cov90-Cylindrotheca_fusiformis.AAC.3
MGISAIALIRQRSGKSNSSRMESNDDPVLREQGTGLSAKVLMDASPQQHGVVLKLHVPLSSWECETAAAADVHSTILDESFMMVSVERSVPSRQHLLRRQLEVALLGSCFALPCFSVHLSLVSTVFLS